jgi:hypothetical protein
MVEKPDSFGGRSEDNVEAIISEINHNNSDIRRQNIAYENLIESDSITNEKLWCKVVDFLSSAQRDSVDHLASEAVGNLYDYMITEEARLRREIGRLSLQREEISNSLAPELEDIKMQEELVAKHLPEISDSVHEIAEKIIGELAVERSEQIEQEIHEAQKEYQDFLKLYESAGEAWPIPKAVALPSSNNALEVDKDAELVIDIFPEPERPAALTTKQIAEKIRRRYPEEILKDASAFVALFLAEEPGRIYSYKDLAEALYGSDDQKNATKVNALISGYQLGKVTIIGDHLRKEGLVLQKGRRYKYNPETKKGFGVRNSVVRAIEPNKASSNETFIHKVEEAMFVDSSWETVPAEKVTDDDQLINDSKNDNLAVNLPDEKKPTIESSGSEDAIEDMTPDNIIDLRDDSVKEKNRKQIPEWEIKLEHDTRQMIETFEEQGLMDKKLPLSRAVFRRKTRSKMHGTKTMIDRALANGIINTQQTDINEPLELYQYICMSLQNDHPEVFSDKRRRKIAVKKVQKLVDDYFTGKKSNQR